MRQARLAKSLSLAAAVVTIGLLVLGQLFGSRGIALMALASFLWLAWRFDNHTGSIFLLAVLLLITFGVIALLMTLMAVVFRRCGLIIQ